MDEHVATPAGRLWLYFNHMRSQLDPNVGIQPVAAAYFGVDPSNTSEYLHAMAQLIALPDAVEEQVGSIDDPTPPSHVLLRPLQRVREIFRSDPLGSNPIHWLNSQATDDVLYGLESTSYVLRSLRPALNVTIDDDALSKIRLLAQEIIDVALEGEDLDSKAREAFVKFGYRIAEAVDMYRVAGAQPLLDELDRFHHENRRVHVPQDSTLWTKFKKITATIVAAVNLFSAPLNAVHAIEGYTELFELTEVTMAPGPSSDASVILAELEEEAPVD